MKYIFLDIDGTLYSPKINAVPYSAMDALKKAKENGHKLFVCTGRSLSAAKLFLNLDVDGFVFSAGAVVYVHGKRVHDKAFRKEDIVLVRKLASLFNLGYCLEGNAGAYYDEVAYCHIYEYFSGAAKNVEEGIEIMRSNCYFPIEYYDENDRVSKICVYAEDEHMIEQLKKELPEEFNCLTTLRNPKIKSHCVEISYKTETKGTAAKIVCEAYGATLKDAIAIGDSSNDFEMIRDCGIGISMGNGSEDIKEIADYITTDILDDGIENAFKHYGII
ncbi:MAG: Cof-type HAD-IIB family hydrolase [Anaerorhabdus sp.]|uniref:Cof-type HAD-IIB family hydrolase n=1 Tax=Anaerorhabdus sp. TaxID=1872524 RepID=UPI003A8AC539